MREELLSIIEKNSRIDFSELAVLLGTTEEVVLNELSELEKEGVITILDELLEYSNPGVLTCVEWAEFSDIELPLDRIEIKIEYLDDTSRKFDFYAQGEAYKKLLEGLKN